MDWFPYDKDLRRERVKAKFGQKLLSRGVLRKRCSDNMQQIYRTPMESNLYRNPLQRGCYPVNLSHISRTSFPENTFGGLLPFGHDPSLRLIMSLY